MIYKKLISKQRRLFLKGHPCDYSAILTVLIKLANYDAIIKRSVTETRDILTVPVQAHGAVFGWWHGVLTPGVARVGVTLHAHYSGH